ncbi:MAG: 4Fe-4S binding protein [Methanomicrobiales archaeon]|nr:4Fe-4S binding protein [Methanomicrobiales archaeon]
MRSILFYLREFIRQEWMRKFIFVRTAPLLTPAYFRDFPVRTGRECTHCLSCMMICPAPGAIEVVREKGEWAPIIHKGHCIRCGLCVEACPEGVLTSGFVLERHAEQKTSIRAEYHIQIDHERCMRCGNCCVACPVNKEVDPQMGAGGYSSNDEVIMRIEGGRQRVIHEERCTGCKTCEETCPNMAIRVARVVEVQQEGNDEARV